MDQTTLTKLADLIAERVSSSEWAHILLLMLLTGIVAAIGSFFGSYFKTKGKNFASKEDFETLSAQLSSNTKLVEDIRSEVSHQDWMKREWINLQRIKLEELLQKLHESERFMDTCQHYAFEGRWNSENTLNPSDEMMSIAGLYFPEIQNDVTTYWTFCKRDAIRIIQLAMEISSQLQGENAGGAAAVSDVYRAESAISYPERLFAISTLKASIRRQLETILPSGTLSE